MLSGFKRWDSEKINLLFLEVVARSILVVPLLDMIQEDKLIWNEERDGLYSVRSGNRKLVEEKN
jgi:hypothetical protein